LREGEITCHPREKNGIARHPRLDPAAEQLQLPRRGSGKAGIHAGAIGVDELPSFRGQDSNLRVQAAGPVHLPEERIDRQRSIARVEAFAHPALAENPHEDHLEAAIPGVGIPQAPVDVAETRPVHVHDAPAVTRDALGTSHGSILSGAERHLHDADLSAPEYDHFDKVSIRRRARARGSTHRGPSPCPRSPQRRQSTSLLKRLRPGMATNDQIVEALRVGACFSHHASAISLDPDQTQP
jgi:hypothetical protein